MVELKVVVLQGDGIGPEVVEGAMLVLNRVSSVFKIKFKFINGLIGGAAIDKKNTPLPAETLSLCRENGIVLLGAVGGPKWDGLKGAARPESGLLEIRKRLDLFANIRPAKIFKPLVNASTIKESVLKNVDFIVLRELSSGIYYGKPRGIKKSKSGLLAFNTMSYDEKTISRIAEVAFQMAIERSKKVTSVDKANVLECSQLWRRTVENIHKKYSEVKLEHMYIDNCAMQMIRNPGQFDIILTSNLFGDILSDEAAMITGSIGMLASASLGKKASLYEPVHGSAPDIAGKNIANPLATILSTAMMFRYSFKNNNVASCIEFAVEKVLESGYRTADIFSGTGKRVGTDKMAALVADNINQ